jgi:hypothetical protein
MQSNFGNLLMTRPTIKVNRQSDICNMELLFNNRLSFINSTFQFFKYRRTTRIWVFGITRSENRGYACMSYLGS